VNKPLIIASLLIALLALPCYGLLSIDLIISGGSLTNQVAFRTNNVLMEAEDSYFFSLHMETEVIPDFWYATNSINAMGTDQNLYIRRNDYFGEYIRTDIRGYECQSVTDTSGMRNGTLVAPDLVLYMAHFPVNGGSIYFVDKDDNVQRAYVLDRTFFDRSAGEPDLMLVKLDHAMTNIAPARILSTRELNMLPDGIPLVCVDRNGLWGVHAGTINHSLVSVKSSPLYPDFTDGHYDTESGTPYFLDIDGSTCLIGKITWSNGDGPGITRELIDELIRRMEEE
jgi:hypothetical protein